MLTFLYAPADRPALVAKALAGPADVVIVDLEDAVAADGKGQARAELVRLLASPQPRVQVRVNDVRTICGQADLRAVGALCSNTAGIRVPKVESADDVRDVARAVPGVALHPLLESALGLERAYEIASADPAVASIGLGEADLRADLGVSDEAGLAWARSRVVVAARAAGLPAPVQSVYTDFRDLEGLAESCRVGRSMGFRGRAAIHPAQLAVIEAAYRPTEEEVTAANEVVAAAGVGAVALPDGRFVDEAVVRQARSVLADALRTPATTPTPTGRCPAP
ncbi:CoA ester lyase [Streptosporangium sp. 'caverna']|uniref:HpcH/HpaI aldolase/citrate lyase family protein n=1 Tax=Streptosporangium sp. 'caverna' TaxID=2202249 RepID=UPI000D7E8A09|nr:CoA ester lyase [Streptosporangium sp. 'caverna']AWS43997.1 CoA ester lyase [Streptosporangium sp. 'caverna']